jgi:hypothetical protein
MRALTCASAVTVALLLATAVCVGAASAQAAPPPACALLTPADMTKVIEGTATQPRSSDIPYTKGPNHDHDGVVHGCGFSIGIYQVKVSYTTHEVTKAGQATYENTIAKREQALQARGVRVEVAKSGGTRCVLAVAKKGEKAGGRQDVLCSTIKGAYLVTVGVASAGEQPGVPISEVKSLLDTACTRLK